MSDQTKTKRPIRLNLLGASGAGVSTLGRALSRELEIPYFDSDDYYHAPSDPPFQSPRETEECFRLLQSDLLPDSSWVLGGGLVGRDQQLSFDFTMIVFVITPRELRIERLKARELERFGERIRPGGDMHAMHQDFLNWAGHYEDGGIEGKTLAGHEAYLAGQSCRVLKVAGDRPIPDLVRDLLAALRDLAGESKEH